MGLRRKKKLEMGEVGNHKNDTFFNTPKFADNMSTFQYIPNNLLVFLFPYPFLTHLSDVLSCDSEHFILNYYLKDKQYRI